MGSNPTGHYETMDRDDDVLSVCVRAAAQRPAEQLVLMALSFLTLDMNHGPCTGRVTIAQMGSKK